MADPQPQSNVIGLADRILQQGWQQPLTGAKDANPDDASRALDLSDASGAPSGAVYEHLDDFDKEYKTKVSNDIVGSDPFLQSYVRSHPLAAKISNDDWGNLGKLSEVLQRVRAGPLGAPASVGQAAVGGFTKAADEAITNYQTISPEQRAAYPQASAALDQIASNPIVRALKATPAGAALTAPWAIDKGLGALFGGVLGAVHEGGKEFAKQVGIPEGTAESLAAEGTAIAEAELGGLTGRSHVGEVPEATAQHIAMQKQVTDAVRLAKPYFDEARRTGQPVELPQGLHPLIDQYHAVQSLLDEKNEDEAFKTAQKSSTKDRNPEFLARNFLDRFQQPNIEVSGEQVLKMYGGKEPSVDDNLLGWVPGIKDQLARAAGEGGDISIPKADWLAKVDPDVRKELKDFTRFRPGGMTPLEAKEALSGEDKPKLDADQQENQNPYTTPAPEVKPGVDRPVAVSDHAELDGLNNTAHLHQNFPDIADEGPHPNIVPENALTGAAKFSGIEVPSQSFNLADITDKLDFDHLPDHTRELNRFFKDRLADMAGNVPVHVVTQDNLDRLIQIHHPDKEGVPGFYDPQGHQIFVRDSLVNGVEDPQRVTHVMLHEAAHAISVNQLHNFPELKKATRALMTETHEYMMRVHPTERVRLAYGFTNEREFIAEAMSNSSFQDILQHVPLPKDLARGFGLAEKTGTIWDMARKIVKELLGKLFGKVPSDTVMDGIFRLNEVFEEATNAMKAEGSAPAQPTQPELPGMTRVEDRKTFDSARALGMKAKTFRNMQDLAKKRVQEDLDYASKKQAKAEAERQSKEWKQEESGVREQVRDAVEHRPDIAADVFLRTGKLFGEKYRRVRLDAAELTKEQKAGLSKEHYGEGGVKPDDLANIVGYQSGDQLVSDLSELERQRQEEGLTPQAHIKQMIETETQREMLAKHGTLEGRLAEDAKEHVLSATNFDILHEDTVRYATEAGQELSFTKDDVKDWAKKEFDQTKVGTIRSVKQLEHVGRVGRKIEDAAAEGDWATAFKLAQQRQVAFQLGREALKFEREQARFDRRAKTLAKRDTKVVPIDYSNAAQDILSRVGKAGRDPANIAKEYKDIGYAGLREWVQSKDISDIFQPDDNFPADNSRTLTVSDFLKDPTYKRDVKEMTVEEFRAVHNSVESIYQNGRREGKFFKGQDAIELNQLLGDLVGQMKDTLGGNVIPYAEGAVKPSMPKVFLASLLQMESIFKRLDRGNPDGLFKTNVTDPIMKAANYKDTLERQFAKDWRGLTFPKNLNKSVANHLFFDPLQKGGEIPDSPAKLTHRNLLAILQNAGNWSNFDKLTGGRNIPSRAVEGWKERGYQLADKDPTMEWLFKHTNKEDWDRAQSIGKMFEDLFEKSENMYYGLGARPGSRIPLRPIETPFGNYDGWYHPVIYDPARPMFPKEGETGEMEMIGGSRKLIGKDPMEDNGFYAPTTPSGYQKARTGYKAPLLLSFDSVPHRMKQMISDIALREAVGEANKVFANPKFRTAMTSYMGHEYTDLLTPYLRDIAGQSKQLDGVQSTLGYWAQWMMQNTVSTLILLNPGTVLKHGPTALASSVGEIGAKRFGSEFLHMWMTPDGWKDFHWMMHGGTVDGENWIGSEEMQRRGRNWNETLSGANYDMFTKGTSKEVWYEKWRQAMIKFGATPVATSDLMSAAPLWSAVYKDRIGDGSTHGDAVGDADKAVRSAHGSTSVAARPAFTRSAWGRVIAPFYTFFNELFNRNYDSMWRLKDGEGYNSKGEYLAGRRNIQSVARGLFYYMVIPALVEQTISPIATDKKSYGMIGAEMLIRQGASMIPGIRDVVEAFMSGNDPTVGVAPVALKAVRDIGNDVYNGKVNLSPEHRGRAVKHAATALGVATGLANAQEGRWGQFAYDYATGRQHPRDFWDWYKALRFGNIKEGKR